MKEEVVYIRCSVEMSKMCERLYQRECEGRQFFKILNEDTSSERELNRLLGYINENDLIVDIRELAILRDIAVAISLKTNIEEVKTANQEELRCLENRKCRKCPECNGKGLTVAYFVLKGVLDGPNYTLCDKCRGVGVLSPALDKYTITELAKIIKGKTADDIIEDIKAG